MRRNGVTTRGRGVGLLVTCITLCLVGASIAVASPAQAVSRDWRHRMLDKVNYVRALAGVAPVHLCRALNVTADGYAQRMSTTHVFSHQGSDGSMPADRMAAAGYRGTLSGENIAAGQDTVVQVMRAWRASPAHYAVMTDPRLRHIGFGFAQGTDGYVNYWVQDYGAGGSC